MRKIFLVLFCIGCLFGCSSLPNGVVTVPKSNHILKFNQKITYENLWRVTDWFNKQKDLEKYVKEFGYDLPLYGRDKLVMENNGKFALFVTGNEPPNYDDILGRTLNRGDVVIDKFLNEKRLITSTQGAGYQYYYITLSGEQGLDTLRFSTVGVPFPQQIEDRKEFKEKLGDRTNRCTD